MKIRAGDLENRQTPTTPSSAMSHIVGMFLATESQYFTEATNITLIRLVREQRFSDEQSDAANT